MLRQEAIAGKCNVICTLRDAKNPQPSSIAIEKADFIFSRFFDVGTCSVVENLPDKIAGVECISYFLIFVFFLLCNLYWLNLFLIISVKFLLNHPKDQKQDHFVKLEGVDSGAFDDNPGKKWGPITDLVKPQLDIKIEFNPGTKKPNLKSDEDYVDNDSQRKVEPKDGLMKHTDDDQEKTDPSARKRRYLSDEDNQDDDLVRVSKASPQMAELTEAGNNTLDVLPQKSNSSTLVSYPCF